MRFLACVIVIAISLVLGACAKQPAQKPDPASREAIGVVQFADNWSLNFEQKHFRRTEDGSIVFWRPGFTMWIAVWPLQAAETTESCYGDVKEGISPKAFDLTEEVEGSVLKCAYRLDEESDDRRLPGFYCYAVGPTDYVQMAIYFDEPRDLEVAKEIWRSVALSTPSPPKAN